MSENSHHVPQETDSGDANSYFIGGTPPFLLFELEYHSLYHLVEHHKNDQLFQKPNPAIEVALIGLVAYFEAFCKHQFAAMVNIAPELLRRFAERRPQTTLKLIDVASLADQFSVKIGSVIAEQYDFGSSKLINGLFYDLLEVSPLSRDEGDRFDGILRERHLLVHHAGIYTLEWVNDRRAIPTTGEHIAFQDSLRLDTPDYMTRGDYLLDAAMKITRITTAALRQHSESLQLVGRRLRAFESLLRGLYDSLG